MEKRYCIRIISCVKDNDTFKSNWYYYGWKKYQGCNVRDLYDLICSDIKSYKNEKVAERVAKRIVEEQKRAYSWLDFSYEVFTI